MPRTTPLGNFEVLGFRRHGFEAVRTPLNPGGLALGGLRPTLALTTVTGPQPVARLPFVEGFEGGTDGNWDGNVGFAFTQTEHYQGSWSSTITAVQGVSSDKYLEFNFGDHPSVGGVATGQRDLYFKFAHKWGSNWQDGGYGSLQKLALLNIHNNVSGARRYQMTFNMWTPDGGYFCEFLRWQEAGGPNGSATANVALNFFRQLDVWQEFVFRVRMNTPGQLDGVLQIWTKTEGDSEYVLRVDRLNINYRDSTTFSPNRIIQSNYQPETVLSGTRYWDGWLLTEEEIDVSPDVQVQDFPVHVPAYVSCVPGVAGPGMDTPGGAGRGTGTTVIFIDSLANENSGTAINASMSLALNWPTPSFIGTPEYAARHAASPKWITPIRSGRATIQQTIPNQTGTPPRPGLTTYAGQSAPSPGLILRGCNWSLNGGSGMVIMHLKSDMGDDATGNSAGNRDCFSSGYAGGTSSQIVMYKCEATRWVDEAADFFRTHDLVTMVNCAFYEPLHRSTIVHPEDGPGVDHGFGPIFGGDTGAQTGYVVTMRCFWAHTTGRNPLINAQEFTHANNLHYNHGRPDAGGAGNGVQLYSSTEPTFNNVLGNLFVRGPNNNASMVAVSVSASMPPGSQGYSFANSQFGWTTPSTQNSFFTSAPAGFVVGGLIDVAYPNSWGVGLSGILQWAVNPLAPTLSEVNAFVDKMERNVGAMARWRTPQNSRLPLMFDQVRNRIAGIAQTDQFVDTVAQSGGFPSLTSVVLNPLLANAPHWHAALPRGPLIHTPYTSGAFSNGISRVGYTPWEEWNYEQDLYVSHYDQVPPNPPTGVTVQALSTSTLRVDWSVATDDEDGSGIAYYRVFRANTEGGTYAQIGADLPASTTQYDDASLGASTTRWYRIYSIDAAGNISIPSTAASGTTNSSVPSTQWADLYGDYTGIAAGISVAGRRYGIRAPTLAGWNAQYYTGVGNAIPYNPAVVGNGAQFSRIDGDSFDGAEPSIMMRPPNISFGSDPADAKILPTNLFSPGSDIAQINFRVVTFFGPRYFDLAAETKWDGFLCSPTNGQPGAASTGRASIFTQKNPPSTGNQFPGVTSGTTQTYNFPPEGYSCDVGPAANKLCRIGGSPDHSINAPRIGNEWVCFEHVLDVRQNRGNPNGMNKFYLWTRDRVANGRFLRIDLTWASWNFANRYIATFEGLGFYFNTLSTAHADNYTKWTHCTFAANMGINDVIGPPDGF